MRSLIVLLVFAACQSKEAPPAPGFRASCKPNANLDALECHVENIGKQAGRACVTAREQPPKAQPIIAKRVCTKVLQPGEKSATFTPKFDRIESLQKVCAPDGTWLCKDEIVESPQQLGENIPQ